MYNTEKNSSDLFQTADMTPTLKQAAYLDTNSIEFEKKKLSLQHGWLGALFGASLNAPINIAGLVLVLLITPGIALIFVEGKISVSDYWQLISPAITLILGYVLANKSS